MYTLIGAVVDDKTYCVDCIPETANLDDKEAATCLYDHDTWLEDVGPCTKCGKWPAELDDNASWLRSDTLDR